MIKIILPIIIIIFFMSYKVYNACNNLHPLLFFMNGLLANYCNNGPFFTIEEKRKLFPFSSEIEANFKQIRKDYLNYRYPIKTFDEMLPEFIVTNKEEQTRNNKFWKILPLKTVGTIIEEQAVFFPSLNNILSNPLIHNAYFSVLEGNVKIPPHTGPYKGYLRYHLGIIIPSEENKRPFIIVGEQKYFWKDGEGILFDDMYEHYVENPTSKDRVVLFIDVIRPLEGIINNINRLSIKLIERNPIMKKILKIQHESIKI